MNNREYFSLANTAVGTTLEDVGAEQVVTADHADVMIEVANLGQTLALSDFSIMVKTHNDATYRNLITSTGWATAGAVLIAKTADINTLAASAAAVALLDVGPVYAFKFQAKVTASAKNLAGIVLSGTDPVAVETATHGFHTGDVVTFASIVGTTELNGNSYTITVVDTTHFTLDDTDSSEYTAYTSGGTATVSDTSVTIKGVAAQK